MEAFFNVFLRLNALIPGNSRHQTTLSESSALNGGRLGFRVSFLVQTQRFSWYAPEPAKTTAVTTVTIVIYPFYGYTLVPSVFLKLIKRSTHSHSVCQPLN